MDWLSPSVCSRPVFVSSLFALINCLEQLWRRMSQRVWVKSDQKMTENELCPWRCDVPCESYLKEPQGLGQGADPLLQGEDAGDDLRPFLLQVHGAPSPLFTRDTHTQKTLTRDVTGSTWCKSHKHVPDLASSNPPITAHHDSQFMTAYKRSHMCVKSSLKPWLSAFLTRFWSLRDQRRWPLPP